MITQQIDYNIIWRNIDPWTSLSPSQSKQQIFNSLVKNIKDRKIFALQQNKFIMLMQPENDWIGKVHIFSDSTFTPFKTIDNITKHFFENSPAIKLYGMVSNIKIAKIYPLKTKWKHEGTLTNAMLHPNGELTDMYMMGANRNYYV